VAPDWGELVAALPEDVEASTAAPQLELQALLGQLSRKPVPVSRFARLWVLGSLQARIAAGYLVHWIRTSYATRNERERQLNETHLKAALKLLGSMSYLRGMIMKVGQALAYYPKLVPDEFVRVLDRLHFEAPPMHYSLLREHVRHELGRDPTEIFAEFEPHAFAAASLGQVHRARLKSGARVAVKIQYPGIARTIQSDFRNMMTLLAPMRLSADWDNIRAQWDDIRQMLTWETDYQREAAWLRKARSVFTDDEDIVIPRPHDDYTTPRVLTMDYLDGVHVDEYLAGQPSQDERDRYGTLIMRAAFRTHYSARIWYSDSNPGNYLFLRDGRLGVIDFGCCRELTEEDFQYQQDYEHALRTGGDALRRIMLQAADRDPADTSDEAYLKFAENLSDWMCGYLFHEGPFDFGSEAFMRRGIEIFTEIGRHRFFRSKPLNTWITRQLLGLRALAYRLRARVDMKRLNEEERARSEA
jgi:predicted unusual protein kinase regulating ubiquinone biosynthesis (AarF/ABC1/UbiB family)